MGFISFLQKFMNKFKLFYVISVLAVLVSLNSCGLYKRSDVKDTPVNVEERVKKNIQEGREMEF